MSSIDIDLALASPQTRHEIELKQIYSEIQLALANDAVIENVSRGLPSSTQAPPDIRTQEQKFEDQNYQREQALKNLASLGLARQDAAQVASKLQGMGKDELKLFNRYFSGFGSMLGRNIGSLTPEYVINAWEQYRAITLSYEVANGRLAFTPPSEQIKLKQTLDAISENMISALRETRPRDRHVIDQINNAVAKLDAPALDAISHEYLGEPIELPMLFSSPAFRRRHGDIPAAADERKIGFFTPARLEVPPPPEAPDLPMSSPFAPEAPPAPPLAPRVPPLASRVPPATPYIPRPKQPVLDLNELLTPAAPVWHPADDNAPFAEYKDIPVMGDLNEIPALEPRADIAPEIPVYEEPRITPPPSRSTTQPVYGQRGDRKEERDTKEEVPIVPTIDVPQVQATIERAMNDEKIGDLREVFERQYGIGVHSGAFHVLDALKNLVHNRDADEFTEGAKQAIRYNAIVAATAYSERPDSDTIKDYNNRISGSTWRPDIIDNLITRFIHDDSKAKGHGFSKRGGISKARWTRDKIAHAEIGAGNSNFFALHRYFVH